MLLHLPFASELERRPQGEWKRLVFGPLGVVCALSMLLETSHAWQGAHLTEHYLSGGLNGIMKAPWQGHGTEADGMIACRQGSGLRSPFAVGGMRPLDLSASACIDTESIDRCAPSSFCFASLQVSSAALQQP